MGSKALGGTELMMNRINQIDPTLLDQFQIIHSRVRDLDMDKKRILVLHDLPLDPECEHLRDGGWKKFDLLVFVSHWQQEKFRDYLDVPYSAGIVLPNAIEPIAEHTKPKDKVRLMYYSTPHRGLDILFAAFKTLAREFPEIELNVFSSFELYGWPENDKPFRELFDQLRQHPQINYHKSVSNDRIREEIERSHIFAYPSTWQETSCLCLIEAMSGGLQCVHSSLAALPETSMGLTQMYGFVEDRQQHADRFYHNLKYSIMTVKRDFDVDGALLGGKIKNDKLNADFRYNWKNRAQQWDGLLRSVVSAS